MKQTICGVFGMIGSALAALLGGWDGCLGALTVCMVIDYLSGSLVALVFHKSPKTETGAYDSGYGLKGLCRKGLMLLLVMVGVQLDRVLGVDYVRTAICLGLMANEVISITENLGLAGIPMPQAIQQALEQLRKK